MKNYQKQGVTQAQGEKKIANIYGYKSQCIVLCNTKYKQSLIKKKNHQKCLRKFFFQVEQLSPRLLYPQNKMLEAK